MSSCGLTSAEMNTREIEQTNKEVKKSEQSKGDISGSVAPEDRARIYDELRRQFLATFQRELPFDGLIDGLELAQ